MNCMDIVPFCVGPQDLTEIFDLKCLTLDHVQLMISLPWMQKINPLLHRYSF